jgi:hypothetical protein
MLNPFFLQGSKGEQNLVQDLINESIQIHGIEIYYIPRAYITSKSVIKEVVESNFSSAYPLEAYVDSYEGYGGQGTILSKFGIQELDDLTLIVSKERFELYITPLIKNVSSYKLTSRPKEGDLIYFPLGDRLFEINYVEHEKPFYQLQKNYVYELRCQLFRYEDEIIDTGITNIDDNVEDAGYIQTFTMVGVGSTATAVASTFNGGVRFIDVTNRGSGYTTSPNVAISSSPSFNGTAVGIASMIGGIVDICEPDGKLLRVQSVTLVRSGYGYTTPPKVIFTGGGGVGAAATAIIADGVIGIITVTSGGSGYTTSPAVTFNTAVIGQTAKAVAIVENGSISEIRILDGGRGYNSAPNYIAPVITIGPPVLVGLGTYKQNEVVVGSASSVTARVKTWNAVTRNLELSNITGKFQKGENLIGQTSGATYQIQAINTDDINDPYAQNDEIQYESNLIVDFSEKNPFGSI